MISHYSTALHSLCSKQLLPASSKSFSPPLTRTLSGRREDFTLRKQQDTSRWYVAIAHICLLYPVLPLASGNHIPALPECPFFSLQVTNLLPSLLPSALFFSPSPIVCFLLFLCPSGNIFSLLSRLLLHSQFLPPTTTLPTLPCVRFM